MDPNEALKRIVESVERIEQILRKHYEPEDDSKQEEPRMVSYEDLCAFVDSGDRYHRRNASGLWRAMVTQLPLDDASIFRAFDKSGSLTIEEFRSSVRSGTKDSYLRRLCISDKLVRDFQEKSELLGADDIRNYGDKARSLLADWLDFLA